MPDEDVKRLGLDHRLVNAWKLKVMVQLGRQESDKDTRVNIYIEPRMCIYYARVPNNQEGTLYANTDVRALQEELREALRNWVANNVVDGREWERVIRIRYSGSNSSVGRAVSAEKTQPRGGHATDQQFGAPDCPELGGLTFSRYERALQPCGSRYDEREWVEDLEGRMKLWADESTTRRTQDEHRRRKPQRKFSVSWDWQRHGGMGRTSKHRIIPWSQESWDRLCLLVDQFKVMNTRLNEFLLECPEERFLEGLSGTHLMLESR